MINNYHLPRKNTSFRFVILHGHLWGGRFQMSVMGGTPRLPAGTSGGHQVEKSIYSQDMQIFWLGDNCRIMEAVSNTHIFPA